MSNNNGCDYCRDNKKLMGKDVICDFNWGWGGETKIKESEADRYNLGIFIDRGYLRYVDLDDCNCLDHGDKIKINYCPICGLSLI